MGRRMRVDGGEIRKGMMPSERQYPPEESKNHISMYELQQASVGHHLDRSRQTSLVAVRIAHLPSTLLLVVATEVRVSACGQKDVGAHVSEERRRKHPLG